ncbi:hypothetical protein BH20ACT2_BH20ACT2_15470 [soil metagenome]
MAQARRERRLTLEEPTDRAGVTPFTVSKVEWGDPTVATRRKGYPVPRPTACMNVLPRR